MDLKFDLKEKIAEINEKLTKDGKFREQFKKEPVKAVESVLGVDLPDEAVKKIIEAAKDKLGNVNLADAAGKLNGEKLGAMADKLGDAAKQAGGKLANGKLADAAEKLANGKLADAAEKLANGKLGEGLGKRR